MRLKPESYWERQIPDPMRPEPHPCFCIGPQNGDPECPCAMLQKRDETLDAFMAGYKAGKASKQ